MTLLIDAFHLRPRAVLLTKPLGWGRALGRWLLAALLLQGFCGPALAQTALAWRPVSGTASTNYGAPYTMNRTFDSSEVSGSYTSGVTSFSTVEGYSTVGGGADGQWFGVYGTASGDLIYDMGQSLFMDRVRFHWANAGGSNSISCLYIDVSSVANFSTFTTVVSNYAKPAGSAATVSFSQATAGRYLRVRWTCLAFGTSSYPGLNEIVVGGRLSGLTGNYYNTTDMSGAVAMSRLDGPVDFDWGAGSPGTGVNADYFSVRWTGHVLVPTTGWYTFQTQSDDGVRLWVNGQQVISNWTLHGPTDDNSAPVYLKAGSRYPIEMNMYEAGGGAVARLRWKRPLDASFVAIPNGDNTQGLYPDTVAVVPDSGILTGAVWWSRANGFVGSDNADIATWSNEVDSTRPLTGSTTRPKYRNNNAQNINFNPVVEFTSTTDTVAGAQYFTAPSMLGTANHTQEHLLFVGYPTVRNRTTTLFSESGSGSSFYTHVSWSDGNLYFDPGVPTGNASARSVYSPTRFVNAPSLYAMLNNGTSSANLPLAGNHGVRQDGQTKVTSTNVASTTGVNSPFRVGWPTANNTWTGVLAEGMLLLGKQLTPTELGQLETYLGVKYGVTLGTDGATTTSYLNSAGATVWAANTGYHHNVAGVARDDVTKLDQRISRSVNSGDQITVTTNATVPSTASVISAQTGAAFATDRSYTIWGDNNGVVSDTVAITAGFIAGRSRSARVWRLQMTGTVPTQLTVCIPDALIPAAFLTGDLTDLKLTGATAADFSAGNSLYTMTAGTCPGTGVGVTTGVPGRYATFDSTVLNGMGGVGYFSVSRRLLDHIEITASSNSGVTCAPTTYTIKACSDASCATPYTGGLTGTLTLSGAGVTANFPSGAAFIIPSGSTTTTVAAQVTTPSTATVGATGLSLTPANAKPVFCGLGVAANSTNACTMSVAEAGLLFSVPHHYAGVDQALSIQAVKKSDATSACVPAFANVTRPIRATCSYLNPNSGTRAPTLTSTSGTSALNAVNNANSACDANGQLLPLAFNASGVASTTLRYWDAGSARLNLSYSGSAGTGDNGLLMTGEASFIAAPAHFSLTGLPASAIVAGSTFNMTVTAQSQGSTGTLTTLPNFGLETTAQSLQRGFVRTGPTGTAAVSGAFVQGTIGSFSGGSATVSGMSYSEVGTIRPTVSLADYLGSGLNVLGNGAGFGYSWVCAAAGGACSLPTGVSGSISAWSTGAQLMQKLNVSGAVTCNAALMGATPSGGCYFRPLSGVSADTGAVSFKPHRLEVSASAACGSFSYAGQPFGLSLSAKNSAGVTTLNYDGSPNTSPNFARAVSLSDATANSSGSLSGSVPASAFSLGVATLASSAATAPVFSFSNKLTAPQTISLRATDTDGVSSSGFDGSQTLRSGRLQMSNAFGSDKSSLQIPLQVQYWSGKSWVPNSADTCTVIPTASVVRAQTLNHNNTAATWSSAISSVSLSSGSGFITLGAPSPSGTGTVDLSINLGSTTTDVSCLSAHPSSTGAGLPWLRSRQGSCASTYDRDPSARATFGVYSPETQRSVHVREIL